MTQPEALRLADRLRDGWGLDLRREAAAELRHLHAQNEALKQTLHDELDGNLRLRELGGARQDETMTAFLERVFAQRDALLEALKAFVSTYGDGDITRWMAVRDQARDAIAKVEGV